MTVQQTDLIVPALGECRFPSPLAREAAIRGHFASDAKRLCFDIEVAPDTGAGRDLSFEAAGPRENIFFDPAEATVALVTCGGLSPGLNNVIRSVFYELTENYGVRRVLGIRNGYLGMNPDSGLEPVTLTREFIRQIDQLGGTVLGSSRGAQDVSVKVDFLVSRKIDVLLCLGGDGTQRGASLLQDEIESRGLPIAIVGIPKTIDNDIPYVRQTFGFATALEKASQVIKGAHVEAHGALNGIGLVKLMGRDAGFIAAGATVVSQEVNFTLVPEVRFPLEGDSGFLTALERRLERRGHAVVVVAEGAGQHLLDGNGERRDASGNVLYDDIGLFLRDRIRSHLKDRGISASLKYIDPSYYIRSGPANTYDRFLCDQMGRHAVHAGMAGKTDVLVGFEHGRFIHVPIPTVVAAKKRMDVTGDLWRAVLQVTGQPRWSQA